jgi:hypothetical protein
MASLSGWTEGIILSLAFVTILALVVANFNVMYGQDNSLPFADDSGAQQAFIEYQTTSQEQIAGGDVAFDAQQGITLKSSWGLAKDAVTISWNFITGGWIERVAASWNLGESATAIAKAIRIIYFLSLVFALLYALFKVVL